MPAFLLLIFGWIKVVPWQVWAIVLFLLILAGAFLYERHAGYKEGAAQVEQTIEDANHASENKADQGAKTVDDCYARGGTWDRINGLCVPTGPR